MKPYVLCFLVSSGLLGCAGEGGQDLNRNLGSRGDDAGTDAQVDARVEEVDGSVEDAAASLDAEPSVADSGLVLDASDQDAQQDAASDAALAAFRIHVEVQNPRAHENPISFQLDGRPVELDEQGFLEAAQPPTSLEIVRGDSDETVITSYRGVENGDALVLLYRHFREAMTDRPVLLPTGQPPAGANSYQMQTGAFSEYVTLGTTALARFYQHGLGSFLLTAQNSLQDTPLAFAFVRRVDLPSALEQPPALGSWLTPRVITVGFANAPVGSVSSLQMLSDGSFYEASATGTPGQFAIPPGFADGLEARIGDGFSQGLLRTVVRCGPDTGQLDLDFATALPLPTATFSVDGETTTVTFDTTAPASLGDVLIFDSIIMPPTQATLTLPSSAVSSGSMLTRIDFASVNSWAELKQKPIDLTLSSAGRWCYGSDQVRISSAPLALD